MGSPGVGMAARGEARAPMRRRRRKKLCMVCVCVMAAGRDGL